MNYQRLEKIVGFLRGVPVHFCACKDGKYEISKGDIHFEIYSKLGEGKIVNAAEGGMLVGEGEHAEVVHHLPVKVDTDTVVLEVSDLRSRTHIEDYHETGDNLNVRFVNPIVEPPILFSLYQQIKDNVESYEKGLLRRKTEQNIALGRQKLDRLLGI